MIQLKIGRVVLMLCTLALFLKISLLSVHFHSCDNIQYVYSSIFRYYLWIGRLLNAYTNARWNCLHAEISPYGLILILLFCYSSAPTNLGHFKWYKPMCISREWNNTEISTLCLYNFKDIYIYSLPWQGHLLGLF